MLVIVRNNILFPKSSKDHMTTNNCITMDPYVLYNILTYTEGNYSYINFFPYNHPIKQKYKDFVRKQYATHTSGIIEKICKPIFLMDVIDNTDYQDYEDLLDYLRSIDNTNYVDEVDFIDNSDEIIESPICNFYNLEQYISIFEDLSEVLLYNNINALHCSKRKNYDSLNKTYRYKKFFIVNKSLYALLLCE